MTSFYAKKISSVKNLSNYMLKFLTTDKKAV